MLQFTNFYTTIDIKVGVSVFADSMNLTNSVNKLGAFSIR